MRIPVLALILAVLTLGALPEAWCQKKRLTPEQILKGIGPSITRPSPRFEWIDASRYSKTIKPHRDSTARSFIVDAATGSERPVSQQQLDSIRNARAKATIFVRKNDIVLKRGEVEVQLTSTPEVEQNPTLSPDGNAAAFTVNGNLYTVDTKSKLVRQLTTDGSDVIMNGYASWVYMEEILGRSTNYKAYWWSPDGRTIAFFRTDDSPVPMFPMVSATGQHGELEQQRYPKAGDPNPRVRVGFVAPEGGSITWADFDELRDQYFGTPEWNPKGTSCYVQWMNRGEDTLRIYDVNPGTGKKREVYAENQKTWIDLDEASRIQFLKNGDFILKSDRSGWWCLSRHAPDGRLLSNITAGKQLLRDIVYLDEDKGNVFFAARNENSARTDLYRVGLDGKGLRRLTSGDFNHSITASPTGDYFIDTYSNVTTPPVTILLGPDGRKIRDLFDAKNPEIVEYELPRTEFIRITSDDGLFELPVVITYPIGFERGTRYPVMLDVYGGPNSPTVSDAWSMYPEALWWAHEGLVQVSCDHRGSGHFGKEGANQMHRNLGYWEMRDYSRVVRWLTEKGIADSTRVGISGYSYGGYTTCYALTYGSEVFTVGLAGGSVVDWSLYDSHYTEKFMDSPAENPEGYKSSSVLTHAGKYKGGLLIVHGMMDDNVHMQNSIQLVDTLTQLNRTFELMLYPESRHGVGRGARSHYANLNRTFIYAHLLLKPMPEVARVR